MKKSRGNKGQFSIIAALLVSIILVAAVIMTYSMIRHNPSRESPKVLTSIGEINSAIKRILEFTVGYYGSIIQVTGNTTYAKDRAASYLQSGLVNIAYSHPEWNPSFEVDFQSVSTRWFMPVSYSMGNISVTYSLSGLGVQGVNYTTSSLLKATILEPMNDDQARINVTREGDEPELRLRRENFFFYNYSYSDSTWNLVNPDSDPITFSDGTYVIQIPSGVDQHSYLIQIVDPRGITVTAFYSEDSLVSGIPQYSYTFMWNSSFYSSLARGTLVVEALQNGTLRWLGQNLQLLEPVGPYVLYGKPSLDNGWDSDPQNIYDLNTLTYGTYNAKTGSAYVRAFNTSTETINRVDVRIRWEWAGDLGSDTVEWVWNIGGSGGGTLYEPCDMSHSLATDSYNAIGSNWTWSEIQDLRVQLNYVKDTGAGPDVNVYEIWILVHVEVADSYEVSQGNPILPIPVKDLRVNQTIDGVNQEVPFQVEDWGSNYRVPLGLTSNASIFSGRNVLAFLVNHRVQKVTLWWDGRDTANQTSYAWKNRYFNDDPDNGVLSNGDLTLYVGVEHLYVDSFSWSSTEWVEVGSSPYLDDDASNYIWDDDDYDRERYFYFEDPITSSGSVGEVRIQFECRCDGDDYFQFRIYNGFSTYGWYSITGLPSSYGWKEYDVSSILSSLTRVSNARIEIRYRRNGSTSSDVFIRRCRLIVDVGFKVKSTVGTSVAQAEFLRINGEKPVYGADTAYVIYNGSVRDIVQQEAEWQGGATNCPDLYSQIFLTLPANTTYYTYAIRTIFVSTSQTRSLSELSALELSIFPGEAGSGECITEDGINGTGFPIPSYLEGLFYNSSSPTGWAHHWSEFLKGNNGAGIMFTNNSKLYTFDSIAGAKTGALDVDKQASNTTGHIEFNPVERYQVSFTNPLDVTWHGAIVTFDSDSPEDTIYPSSGGNIGLWVMVEHPPIVAVS